MKKYLSTLTLIFVSIAAFSQSTVNPKTKFVGKWLLVKHTFTEKGKTEDLLTANEVYTYDFAANGTYAVSYTDKKKESTTVYKGKWQVIGGGKK